MPRPALPLPPASVLNQLLIYSIVTGEVYYRERPRYSCIDITKPAGAYNTDGYLNIKISGQPMKLHRVIWKMVTGEDPGDMLVDHADRVRDNNAWHNLRLVTNRGNNLNNNYSCIRKAPKAKSGWIVTVDCKYVGYYSTYEAACQARDEVRESVKKCEGL